MTANPAPTGDAFLAAAEAAGRAPSLHNSQPWRFRLRAGAMEILADPTRRLVVADPTGWAMRIACGAAAFNARLALAVRDTPVVVRLRPEPTEPDLLVRLCPLPARPPTPADRDLHTAIPRRRSNRRPFHDQPVPLPARARLVQAAREEGAWLELLVGAAPLGAVGEIVRAADRVLNRDPDYAAEIARWTRPGAGVDGVPSQAGGPSPEPGDLLAQRDFGGRPRAPGRDFEAEPLVAIIGVVGDSAVDQLTAGLALQRVLLTAADAGLSSSMLSQPIEVPTAREMLRTALGRSGTPQLLIRFGYGQPAAATPRRPVGDTIVGSGPDPRPARPTASSPALGR
jgi:nitroreductase